MSGVLFDALLPDFTLPGRAANPEKSDIFEPLIQKNVNGSKDFQPLLYDRARADSPGTLSRKDLPSLKNAALHERSAGNGSNPGEKNLDANWERIEKLEAEHAAEVARMSEIHSAEIAALKDANAAATAALLHTSLETVQKTLHEALERHLVAILGPLLTKKHQRASIEKLADDANAILSDPAIARLNVSGPPALLDLFRAALGDKTQRYVLTPSEGLELLVTIDESVMSTSFGEWQAELERVAYE